MIKIFVTGSGRTHRECAACAQSPCCVWVCVYVQDITRVEAAPPHQQFGRASASPCENILFGHLQNFQLAHGASAMFRVMEHTYACVCTLLYECLVDFFGWVLTWWGCRGWSTWDQNCSLAQPPIGQLLKLRDWYRVYCWYCLEDFKNALFI